MACEVCGHTVQSIGVNQDIAAESVVTRRIFWCPRCGTLITEDSGGRRIAERSMLAGRIRDAESDATTLSVYLRRRDWDSIREAAGAK